MYTSGSDPYEDLYTSKEAFLLQVTEKAIMIMYPDLGGTSVIGFSYEQWDRLVSTVIEMKMDSQKSLPGNTDTGLKKPLFNEIDWKSFPK